MLMDRPIGFLFIHKGRYFYYDTNVNNIIEIDKKLYINILFAQKGKLEQIEDQRISHLIAKGYLRGSHIERTELLDSESLRPYVQNCATQLILQVTKGCNMRCRYCTYAGDGFYERTHSDTNMAYETAKEAIDLFYLHTKDSNEINISFYGGEPLLNFDIIRQAIEYAEKKYCIKRCNFSVTTNGVLLEEKHCDFFYKHNVHLAVSIDGPREIHNKNRKLRSGRGSFDIVHSKLLNIYSKAPDYYRKFVSVHPVITPSSDVESIIKYFMQDLHIDQENIALSNVSLEGLDLLFDENDSSRSKALLEHNQIEEDKIFYTHKSIYLNKMGISSSFHHTGPCIPLSKKLFVSTDGYLYPCEKINENNPINCIGNVWDGVDYEAIYKIFNIGLLTEEKCKCCWAIRYCNMCIADIDSKDFDEAKKIKVLLCENKKRSIVKSFKRLIDQKDLVENNV